MRTHHPGFASVIQLAAHFATRTLGTSCKSLSLRIMARDPGASRMGRGHYPCMRFGDEQCTCKGMTAECTDDKAGKVEAGGDGTVLIMGRRAYSTSLQIMSVSKKF